MNLTENKEKRKMPHLPILNVPSMSFTPNAIIHRNDSKSIMKLFETIRSKPSSVIYFIFSDVGYLPCDWKIYRSPDAASPNACCKHFFITRLPPEIEC